MYKRQLSLYVNLGDARESLPPDLSPAATACDLLFESLPGAFDALRTGSVCGNSAVYLLENTP